MTATSVNSAHSCSEAKFKAQSSLGEYPTPRINRMRH